LSLLFGVYSFNSSIYILAWALTERKHGHPDKLFQYCSTDIDTLVQRQIRVRSLLSLPSPSPLIALQFDGDRDLRTPHDFVGGANSSRLDDVGDDDDEGDADDPPKGPYGRHDGTKGKSIPESGKPWGPKPEATSEVRPAFTSYRQLYLTHPFFQG